MDRPKTCEEIGEALSVRLIRALKEVPMNEVTLERCELEGYELMSLMDTRDAMIFFQMWMESEQVEVNSATVGNYFGHMAWFRQFNRGEDFPTFFVGMDLPWFMRHIAKDEDECVPLYTLQAPNGEREEEAYAVLRGVLKPDHECHVCTGTFRWYIRLDRCKDCRFCVVCFYRRYTQLRKTESLERKLWTCPVDTLESFFLEVDAYEELDQYDHRALRLLNKFAFRRIFSILERTEIRHHLQMQDLDWVPANCLFERPSNYAVTLNFRANERLRVFEPNGKCRDHPIYRQYDVDRVRPDNQVVSVNAVRDQYAYALDDARKYERWTYAKEGEIICLGKYECPTDLLPLLPSFRRQMEDRVFEEMMDEAEYPPDNPSYWSALLPWIVHYYGPNHYLEWVHSVLKANRSRMPRFDDPEWDNIPLEDRFYMARVERRFPTLAVAEEIPPVEIHGEMAIPQPGIVFYRRQTDLEIFEGTARPDCFYCERHGIQNRVNAEEVNLVKELGDQATHRCPVWKCSCNDCIEVRQNAPRGAFAMVVPYATGISHAIKALKIDYTPANELVPDFRRAVEEFNLVGQAGQAPKPMAELIDLIRFIPYWSRNDANSDMVCYKQFFPPQTSPCEVTSEIAIHHSAHYNILDYLTINGTRSYLTAMANKFETRKVIALPFQTPADFKSMIVRAYGHRHHIRRHHSLRQEPHYLTPTIRPEDGVYYRVIAFPNPGDAARPAELKRFKWFTIMIQHERRRVERTGPYCPIYSPFVYGMLCPSPATRMGTLLWIAELEDDVLNGIIEQLSGASFYDYIHASGKFVAVPENAVPKWMKKLKGRMQIWDFVATLLMDIYFRQSSLLEVPEDLIRQLPRQFLINHEAPIKEALLRRSAEATKWLGFQGLPGQGKAFAILNLFFNYITRPLDPNVLPMDERTWYECFGLLNTKENYPAMASMMMYLKNKWSDTVYRPAIKVRVAPIETLTYQN